MNRIISTYLLNRGYFLLFDNISTLYTKFSEYQKKYFWVAQARDIVTKKQYINYKLSYFQTFIKLKHLYLKKFEVFF